MATKKSQRVFIWVIAIVMVIGTFAGFLAMILQPKNDAADQARMQQLMAEYQKEQQVYQDKLAQQTKGLSERYFETFKPYKARATAFDKASVKELAKEDLQVGAGKDITDDMQYAIYYVGWNPEGKIFDSSFSEDGNSLKRPLVHQTDGMWDFGNGQPGGVIEGWTEGLKGMKVGGVRQLVIPSDKAYGENGQGDDIPANTPLTFIMMAIEAPETITAPQPSAELLKLYQSNG